MKNYVLALLTLACPCLFFAQTEVPNGNFEQWLAPKLTGWVPEYWETSNYFEYPSTIPDSTSFEGNLAMQVRPIPGFEGAVPQQASVLFSIDEIPAALHFAVRAHVEPGNPEDQVSVRIHFLFEDAIIDTHTWSTFESIDDWQEIVLEIAPSELQVDEAIIVVQAGYTDGLGGGNIATWISVDAMSLEATSGVADTSTPKLLVYPNPCFDILTLYGFDNTVSFNDIRILDGSGRDCSSVILPGSMAFSDKICLDLLALASGLYQVVVQSGDPNKSFAVASIVKQ